MWMRIFSRPLQTAMSFFVPFVSPYLSLVDADDDYDDFWH